MRKPAVTLAMFLAIAVTVLFGCGSSQTTSSGGASDAEGIQAGYKEEEMTLLARTEDAPDKVAVRFYDDSPSVPYIGLAKYMSLVFGDEAKAQVDGGVATITSTDGGVAVIDDAADTLTSDSWSAFHNYLEPMQQGKCQGYLDFAPPFCRISSLDYDKQTEPLVFDFSKYGINLHVDSDDAYIPLATASDLMADPAYNGIAYNGNELCLLDGYDIAPQGLDPAWYEPIAADEPRAQDMADYTYGELCFVMDNMYSCSGKGILDEDIAAHGLDATLEQKDDVTQRVRELIKSTDKAEYIGGLTLLGQYVDNGHTGLIDSDLGGAMGEELFARTSANVKELGDAYGTKDYASQAPLITSDPQEDAATQRSQIWKDGASYHEQGDTAVISIDSFLDYDQAGWNAYYAGTGERPDGTQTPDCIGTLLAGLDKAKSNPSIRNVVIDVTTNGGGSNDLCITATALVRGLSQVPFRDLSTGLRYSINYNVDSLFDKSFDSAAAASGYDFNYAVLTSSSSFSCGNLFPSLLHDAGIPVIGERSGGGTDMIIRMFSPDGQCLQMTDGFAEMTDADGNQIEEGVPVDAELVKVNADGTKDYSALYDIDNLSKVVGDLYAKETLAEAA